MTIQLSERFPELTRRQCQVCALLLRGMSNKEVGRNLGVSGRTAEDHRRDIFDRLRVHNIMEVANKLHGNPEIVA